MTFNYEFTRRLSFFITYYLFPSILFVLIAYSQFYIDQAAVPARVTIGITSILIQINLNIAITNYIPQVSYSVALSDWLLASLVFAAISLIEFAALNFSTTNYKRMRLKINEFIGEINGFKTRSKELLILEEMRME